MSRDFFSVKLDIDFNLIGQGLSPVAITGTTILLPGLILGLCPANERRRYKVTPSLIGWAQT